MSNERLTLHIVQNLATPHNNSLVRALRDRAELRVVTWYAKRTAAHLPWKEGLGGEIDNYYFDTWSNRWRLIQTFLFHPTDKFMVVGYSNFGTRFIFIASWLLRRHFMYWTDHPQEKKRSFFRSTLRSIAFHIMQSCARPIFVVGRHTKETFKRFGFNEDHLVNLPILIDIPTMTSEKADDLATVRQQYNVRSDQLFCVAASRLTYNKGYDLLIRAVARLDPIYLSKLKVLIVGTGPEEGNLQAIVRQTGLVEQVAFETWLEPDAYTRVIRAADVFAHPARFDAFGGGTLYAMALGVPVIGSNGVGSVIERVESGVNGLIYPAEDIEELANGLVRLMNNPAEREDMGLKARATAERWSPSMGAKIIFDCLKPISGGEKNI